MAQATDTTSTIIMGPTWYSLLTPAQLAFVHAVEACPPDAVSDDVRRTGAAFDLKEYEEGAAYTFCEQPMEIALRGRKWALCDWLLAHGADPNKRMVYAIHDRAALEYLRRAPGLSVERYRDAVLVWAAIGGVFDLAQEMLDAGGDIHFCPPGFVWRDFALFNSAVCGNAESVEWLLARGADPHVNYDKILEVTAQRGLTNMHTRFVQLRGVAGGLPSHTAAATTIPNDQTGFAKWLYGEDNGMARVAHLVAQSGFTVWGAEPS